MALILMSSFASAIDTIEDLEETEITILPIYPLYFAKEWYNGFRLAFASSSEDKARVELSIAREKLVEAVHLRAMNRHEWAVRQLSEYEARMVSSNAFNITNNQINAEKKVLNETALTVMDKVRERVGTQDSQILEQIRERTRTRIQEKEVLPIVNDSSGVDLRSLVTEKYSNNLGQIETACGFAGGTWVLEKNIVGCKNILFYLDYCSNSSIVSAFNECERIGGTAVCNSTNIYCEVD